MSGAPYATRRACPVCGGHRAVALHEQQFALPEASPLPPAYTIASCEDCGACFADTSAPQSAYDRHYRQFSKYDDPALGTGGGGSPSDRERLAETAELLAAQQLPSGKESRLLDVGCAGGGLLLALAARGFRDLSGVDPSEPCVERVRRHGFRCHGGMLSGIAAARPAGMTWDVVVLSHVVEHVVDVRASLRAVRDLLADGGVCYVEVPDAARYAADAFVPFYFFDAEHINHFDRAALSNLASVTGFDVGSEGARELRLEGGKRYPARWSLFRKSGRERAPTRDLTLRRQLSAYVEASTRAQDPGAFDALATSHRPVLLWGAGSHAQRMLRNSPLGRCNLIGVVDRDPGKQGQALLGHEIRDPDAVLDDLAPDVTIVIASVLHGDEIAASIAAAGHSNPLMVAR